MLNSGQFSRDEIVDANHEDREIDIIVSKALSVLGHPEFFEPIRNLLHGGPLTVSSWHDGVFDHRNRESIPIYPRYHANLLKLSICSCVPLE
jgi:hypothetical protein